jgi:hypothetical protein
MTRFMEIRKTIITLVKRFEIPLRVMCKFAAGFYVFSAIDGIGLYAPQAAGLFEGGLAPFLPLMFTLLFTIAPTSAAYALIAGALCLQMSRSVEIAALTLILCLLVILFYVRLAPKASWLLLATFIAFRFNAPYAVVLFSGLYVGVSAVVPVALGCWAAMSAPAFLALAKGANAMEGFDVVQFSSTAVSALDGAFQALFGSVGWVVFAFVFAVIILGMFAVSYAPVPYAKEVRVGFGVAACVVCFAAVSAVMEGAADLLSVALGAAVSGAAVFIIRLFDSIPDYGRTERVRFEDDENLYFVKIIPKR